MRSLTGYRGMFIHVRPTLYTKVAQLGVLSRRQEPNARFPYRKLNKYSAACIFTLCGGKGWSKTIYKLDDREQ